MNLHQNARLTPHGREWIVRQAASGQTPKAIATAVGVCPRTVRKWLKRYREEGLNGLLDRIGHRITGDRTGQSNSRGIGWEYVHVCIDDASRIAFCQILPDEKAD